MGTGACSQRSPAPSRRCWRAAIGGLRQCLSVAGAPRQPLVLQQAIEHGADFRDDAVDDPFPELARSGVGIPDHAPGGEPRIIGAPWPGRSAIEDQRLDRLLVQWLLGSPDLVAAHQMRRERQHHRGLAFAAMDVGRLRRPLGLRQIERVDDAGIDPAIAMQLADQIFQDAAIAAVAVDDHQIARRQGTDDLTRDVLEQRDEAFERQAHRARRPIVLARQADGDGRELP